MKAIEYIETFPPCSRINLSKKYPAAPKEAIDFLDRLLVFNPFFRMTLEEAIAHPVFDEVRIEREEQEAKKITLEFENIPVLN